VKGRHALIDGMKKIHTTTGPATGGSAPASVRGPEEFRAVGL